MDADKLNAPAVLARGVGLGLALFAAWVAAMAFVFVALFYIEYWLWAIFPACFIALGIRVAKDRAIASQKGLSDAKG